MAIYEFSWLGVLRALRTYTQIVMPTMHPQMVKLLTPISMTHVSSIPKMVLMYRSGPGQFASTVSSDPSAQWLMPSHRRSWCMQKSGNLHRKSAQLSSVVGGREVGEDGK
uniref:Uncharacterized protein n=1 Tax=Anopheles culicifacies TaxID=139723 RepID=A0A182MH98_9DIPT